MCVLSSFVQILSFNKMSGYPTKVLLTLTIFNFMPFAHGGAGIDVSSYQGTINWEKVRSAGITFAVARATVGQGKTDSYFTKNWSGMKTYNITPAAYHYFKGSETAQSQATNIKTTLASTDFDQDSDILAIDVEQAYNTDVSADTMAGTLNDLMGNLSGFNNLYIYTNYYYWENSVSWKKYDFSLYNLWIAFWSSTSTPIIPTTWKSIGYTWWQYSDSGRVSGVSGSVDLDRNASTNKNQ